MSCQNSSVCTSMINSNSARIIGMLAFSSSAPAIWRTSSLHRVNDRSCRKRPSCRRNISKSNCFASRSSSTSSDGNPATSPTSSFLSSGPRASHAAAAAYFSTSLRFGRTMKLFTFICATSWRRRSATSPRKLPVDTAASCLSSSAISSTRPAKSFLLRDSLVAPDVVPKFWLKNSRFWQ